MNKPVGPRFGQPGKSDIISKFRTGKFRPGIVLNIAQIRNGTRISVWNIPTGINNLRLSNQLYSFSHLRDLFTDTAAILNLLDLRSIMGCPGGTRSVFTRAFRAKRELHCIFLGKKAIIITSKHGTTIFFSYYNLFLGKLKEKLARKARVNTDASISDRAHAPWASHNTP